MQTLALVENGAKIFIVSRNQALLEDVAKKYGGSGRGEIIAFVSPLPLLTPMTIPLYDELTSVGCRGTSRATSKESLAKVVAEVEK